jgi:hypothetical protein
VTPEVAALADDLARSSPPLTRIASLARSPTSALALAVGLDVGADAAVPQQVDRCQQNGRISSAGVSEVTSSARGRAHLGVTRDGLRVRAQTPPPSLISDVS